MEPQTLSAVPIITVDTTEVYHVVNEKGTLITAGPLNVVYLTPYNFFVIQINDFSYTLAKEIPVLFKSDKTDILAPQYAFPYTEGYYVIKIRRVAGMEVLSRFDSIINNHCDLIYPDGEERLSDSLTPSTDDGEEAKTEENMSGSTKEKTKTEAAKETAKEMLEKGGEMAKKGGEMAKSGLTKGAKAVSKGITGLTSFVKSKLDKDKDGKDGKEGDKKEEKEKAKAPAKEAAKQTTVAKTSGSNAKAPASGSNGNSADKLKEGLKTAAIVTFTVAKAESLMNMGKSIAKEIALKALLPNTPQQGQQGPPYQGQYQQGYPPQQYPQQYPPQQYQQGYPPQQYPQQYPPQQYQQGYQQPVVYQQQPNYYPQQQKSLFNTKPLEKFAVALLGMQAAMQVVDLIQPAITVVDVINKIDKTF